MCVAAPNEVWGWVLDYRTIFVKGPKNLPINLTRTRIRFSWAIFLAKLRFFSILWDFENPFSVVPTTPASLRRSGYAKARAAAKAGTTKDELDKKAVENSPINRGGS